jgi:K(+)-stimulated pyrophosphate-energized sodium pump
MDRLAFDTASASLRESSSAQLNNLAAILRAFPNIMIKLGGYTDNTGNVDAKLKLSDERAP